MSIGSSSSHKGIIERHELVCEQLHPFLCRHSSYNSTNCMQFTAFIAALKTALQGNSLSRRPTYKLLGKTVTKDAPFVREVRYETVGDARELSDVIRARI